MTHEAALDRMIEKLESRLARLRANLDSNDDLVTWERGRIEGLQVALEDAQLLKGIAKALPTSLATLFAEGQRIPELDNNDLGELTELVLEEISRRVGHAVELDSEVVLV